MFYSKGNSFYSCIVRRKEIRTGMESKIKFVVVPIFRIVGNIIFYSLIIFNHL